MPTTLAIALPVPFRRLFEYLPPEGFEQTDWKIGVRVLAPFGKGRTLVGLLVEIRQDHNYPLEKLKPIETILDPEPLLSADIFDLCGWASEYYQCPLGEVFHTALPSHFRRPAPVQQGVKAWEHTPLGLGLGADALKRSPKQQWLHRLLLDKGSMAEGALLAQGVTRPAITSLEKKGLIQNRTVVIRNNAPLFSENTALLLKQSPPNLSEEQTLAVNSLRYHLYQTYLLEGVTGSGKTEVYFQAAARVLQAGGQVLILVPEIGLTPQTVQRVRDRFAVSVVELHSNIADGERAKNWLAASQGMARIVVGTRLAIFTPMPQLGLIILDEEHDLSFKQQEGLRYSARDVAVMRAYRAKIPLILGSATPSLESLLNTQLGRYQWLSLTHRAVNSQPIKVQCVDLKHLSVDNSLPLDTLNAITETLNRHQQVLVFINRRGFAPAFICRHCGWVAQCPACSARMTLHQHPRHLHCHHCNTQKPLPNACPQCRSKDLTPLGQGTEKVEHFLQRQFPATSVIRVDQDSMQAKLAMTHLTQRLNEGNPCILVGTQMLAKGHHFPKLTLVVLLDLDQGLMSGDFRGPERMGQLFVQVSGRAGRSADAGKVVLQSYQLDHPLLQSLLHSNYRQFAEKLLQERQVRRLPPFWSMALLRAESKHSENALKFLQVASAEIQGHFPSSEEIHYIGPMPALLEKRSHRFRYQFQITCLKRQSLQLLLKTLAEKLETLPSAKSVRWSIDVDPQDMS